MARALIVACGCRGRALADRLTGDGWIVRGTTRRAERFADLEAAGIEPALADPDRATTVLDQIADVAVILWLLGSALGEPEAIAAIHGPRLERILEEIVDTPVRGFVYEAAGRVQPHDLERGAGIVRAASDRWRIPVEVVDQDPADWRAWVDAMAAASGRLVNR